MNTRPLLLLLLASCSPPTVAMFGDSTTLGATLTPTGYVVLTDKSEPADVGRATGLLVANHGVGGTSIVNLYPETVTAAQADIVTINYGLNDSFFYGPDVFLARLDQLVVAARAAGKTLVIETSNPFVGAMVGRNAELEPIVEAERAYAAAHGVLLVDQYAYPVNCPDGLHPDPAGYQAKAERMAAMIRKVAGQ